MFKRRASTPEIKTVEMGQQEMVRELSALLRKNGNKILHGNGKLSLITTSLSYLNECFNALTEDRQNTEDIIKSKDDKFHQDLVYLHQFVQDTPALKVMHGNSTLQGTINICWCQKLRTLEIKRVPLHLLVGLQTLRTQLKVLICTRCVQTLQELFSSCGGDKSSEQAWPELRTVCLSFNHIHQLDDSLKLLTAVCVLDLSHNNITDVGYYLEYLSELTHLNLGYNQLERMPALSISARNKLQSLVMRNNRLENLQGLEQFRNLQELDVANNCIVETIQLMYFSPLHLMTRLILQGNPVCFHPYYRITVVKNLSPAVVTQKVYLDGRKLTNVELKYLPKGDVYRLRTAATMFEASVNSTDSLWLDTSQPSSLTSGFTDDDTDSLVYQNSKSGSKGKSLKGKKNKKSKHRRPCIDDQMSDTSQPSSRAATPFIDGSDIQQRVEAIREEMGPDWLVGLTAKPKADSPSEPNTDTTDLEQTPEGANHDQPPAEGTDQLDSPVKQRYESVSSDIDVIGRQRIPSTDSEEGVPSLGGPFIVTVLGRNSSEKREILLTITEKSIQERDVLDGKILEKLDMKSIKQTSTSHEVYLDEVSGHHSTVPIVSVMFNYIHKDRQKRQYVMEDEENCQALLDILTPMTELNKSQSSQSKQNVQCLKCSHVFGKSEAHKKIIQRSKTPTQMNVLTDGDYSPGVESIHEVPVCPNCASEMLVELDQPKTTEIYPTTPIGSLNSTNSPRPLATSSPWRQKEDSMYESCERNSSSDYLTADTDSFTSPTSKSTLEVDTVSSTSTLTSNSVHMDSNSTVKAYSINDVYSPHQRTSDKRYLELEFLENEIAKSDVFQEKEAMVVVESDGTSTGGELDDFQTKKVHDLLKAENKEEFTQRYSLVPAEMFSSSDSDGSGNGRRGRPLSETNSPIREPRKPAQNLPAVGRQLGKSDYPSGFPNDAIDSSVTTPTENAAFGRVPSGSSLHRETTQHGAMNQQYNNNAMLGKRTGEENQMYDSRNEKQDGYERVDSSSSDIAVLSNPSQSSIAVLMSPSSEFEPSVYDMQTSVASATSSSGVSSTGLPRSASLNESLLMKNSSSERVQSPESGIYDTTGVSLLENSPSSETNPTLTAGMCASLVASVYKRALDSDKQSSSRQSQGDVGWMTSSQSDSEDLAFVTPLNSFSSTPPIASGIASIIESSGSFTDSSTVYSTDSRKNSISEGRHKRSRNVATSIHYNYDDYTMVDHRLKLYCMMTLFKHNEEEFECLLKATVFHYSKSEQYLALLVVSSHYIYILKVTKEETDKPSDWLTKKGQHPITDLFYIDIGPCHQSFRLEFTNDGGCYTFLMRDSERCQRVIECLAGIVHQTPSNRLKEVNQENQPTLANILTQIFANMSDDNMAETDTDLVLYLLAFQKQHSISKQGDKSYTAVSIIVTSTDICLAEENHHWPLPRLQQPPAAVRKTQQFKCQNYQKISNISCLELYEDTPCQVRLQFFNEDTGDETNWDMMTETETSLTSLITAIKEPWESLFSVDLQQTVHPTIDIQDL